MFQPPRFSSLFIVSCVFLTKSGPPALSSFTLDGCWLFAGEGKTAGNATKSPSGSGLGGRRSTMPLEGVSLLLQHHLLVSYPGHGLYRVARGKSARARRRKHACANADRCVISQALLYGSSALALSPSSERLLRMRRDATSTLIVDLTSAVVFIGHWFVSSFFLLLFLFSIKPLCSSLVLVSSWSWNSMIKPDWWLLGKFWY